MQRAHPRRMHDGHERCIVAHSTSCAACRAARSQEALCDAEVCLAVHCQAAAACEQAGCGLPVIHACRPVCASELNPLARQLCGVGEEDMCAGAQKGRL
jgi:hypothetical protein